MADAPRRRPRELRELNLQRIRAAAIAEFSLHGFRGATTDAIARRAGMTRPQLHYYIAGKEALYEELLQSILDQWAHDSFDHASDDPAQVLGAYIRDKVRHASENPELARMFGLEMLSGAPNLGKYWPRAIQITQGMVDTMERWMAEGRMQRVNAHLLLMNIWAMACHQAYYAVQVEVMARHAPGVPMDPESMRRQITHLVLSGCGLASV